MSLYNEDVANLIQIARDQVQLCDRPTLSVSLDLIRELEAAHQQLAMIKKAWMDCGHWPDTSGDRRALHIAIEGNDPTKN